MWFVWSIVGLVSVNLLLSLIEAPTTARIGRRGRP